jgi:hypothetical protein
MSDLSSTMKAMEASILPKILMIATELEAYNNVQSNAFAQRLREIVKQEVDQVLFKPKNVKVHKKPKFEKSSEYESVKPDEKRWEEDNFHANLKRFSYNKTFLDGSVKQVVACTKIPRWVWPLNTDGKMYQKIQDLCEDFDYQCIRDDPSKPTCWIVIDKSEEKVVLTEDGKY